MKKKMKKIRSVILGIFVLFAIMGAISHQFSPGAGANASDKGSEIPTIPVEGMVTMLDLGATKCIPCKMMAPILEALKKEYEGRAAIIFIDVWDHREYAQKYGIRAIPTQIFFNKEGKEVYRHIGFMDKESIVKKLQELGAV